MASRSEKLDDVFERCAEVRTLKAARTITRLYDDALRPASLTGTQFTLLVAIGKMKPHSISAVGEALSVDRTSLTRNLRLLETADYVVRGDEGAKRRRQLKLTKQGFQKIEEAYPMWQSAQAKVEEKFPGPRYGEALEILETLRSAG